MLTESELATQEQVWVLLGDDGHQYTRTFGAKVCVHVQNALGHPLNGSNSHGTRLQVRKMVSVVVHFMFWCVFGVFGCEMDVFLEV